MSSLPPPPSTRLQNSDESMRQWLSAKAEEDRRRQEEERTRQESLKLDQRKVEQSMLRDSLQAGVPPYMVPFIFASLSGGNMQWAQQYVMQMSQLHSPKNHGYVSFQDPPQTGGEIPRDNRAKSHNPYAAQHASSLYDRTSSVPLSRMTSVEPPQQSSSVSVLAPSPSASDGAAQTQRLTASTKKDAQEQNQPVPPIQFYHWVPPGQPQQNGNESAGKSPNNSPHTPHPHSHLRPEYQNFPKKRKAQGNHHQQPPPPPHLAKSTSLRARVRTDIRLRGISHNRKRSDATQSNEIAHGLGRHGEPGVIIWQSQKPEPAVDPATSRWYDNNLHGSARADFEAGSRREHVNTPDDSSRKIPPDPPSRTASSSSATGSFYCEVYRPGHDGPPQPSRPVDAHATSDEHRQESPSNVAMAGMSYDPVRPSPSRLASA